MADYYDAIMINSGEVVDRLDVCPTGKIITTTKGDIIVDVGSKTIRFPIGSSGEILTVDPTRPECIRWAAPTEIASGVVSTTLSDRRPTFASAGPARFENAQWNTRHFTTLVDTEGGTEGIPTIDGVKLIGSQIHLQPGAYFTIAFFPAYRVGAHQSRLLNLAGTRQISTVTVNSIPVAPSMGSDPENFVIYTRGLIFTIWYNVDNNNPTLTASELDDHYIVNDFAHIKVDTTSGDTTTNIATKTAAAINNSSWNLYPNTSSNIFFTATSSVNIITINHKEIGPCFTPHNGTNSPGTGNWVYGRTAGTFTLEEIFRNGTSADSNTGASQASTITTNLFHEIVIDSSSIVEFQHRVESGSNDIEFTGISFGSGENEALGSPTGLSTFEIYSNGIFHKIA